MKRKPALEKKLLTEWERLSARLDKASPRTQRYSSAHRKATDRYSRIGALLSRLERRH